MVSAGFFVRSLGMAFRDLLACLAVRHQAPRLVRRTTVHCPSTGAPVEVDVLMKKTGAPDVVLRCSAHPECPPTCDQACREVAELVLRPARALIICPPGSGPPEDFD